MLNKGSKIIFSSLKDGNLMIQSTAVHMTKILLKWRWC